MRLDHLAPFKSRKILRIVIETPKGSRNKYSYDPQVRAMGLSKTLPEGMVFPFNFGFIPRTEGQDGDPLDVLVLMDEPVPPGIVVPSRLVGLMQAVQIEGRKRERNDRYIAVALSSLEFESIHDARRLPAHIMDQIEKFFMTYNELAGRKFVPRKVLGPDRALREVKHNRAGG